MEFRRRTLSQLTANRDGTIPLSSRIAAELVKDNIQTDLLIELVRRANSASSVSQATISRLSA
jgi:hypothetical protein